MLLPSNSITVSWYQHSILLEKQVQAEQQREQDIEKDWKCTEQTHSAHFLFEPTSETEKQMENSRNGWGQEIRGESILHHFSMPNSLLLQKGEKDRSYQEEVSWGRRWEPQPGLQALEVAPVSHTTHSTQASPPTQHYRPLTQHYSTSYYPAQLSSLAQLDPGISICKWGAF